MINRSKTIRQIDTVKLGIGESYWTELPDGTFYFGETHNGLPHGNGIIVTLQENQQNINEVIYEGSFLNGKYHGNGVRYYNNRKLQDGIFAYGRFIQGAYFSPSGVIQHGVFNELGNLHSNNHKDVKGKLILPTGGYLKGFWENGKPVGEFDVFLGAGRVPMKYNFSKKDDNTKFNIMLYNEMIFFDDRYLLGPGDVFLYYYNGDIFMGQVNSRTEPVNGILYKLIDGKYVKMQIGNKRFDDEKIKMSYNENSEIKDCIIQV